MPADDARDRLESAVAASGYVCCECGSGRVTIEYGPLLGHYPVIIHGRGVDGDWCPATHGGVAAARASLDLLDSLLDYVAMSSYAEPVFHRRERVS